jgi:hypothetical protein
MLIYLSAIVVSEFEIVQKIPDDILNGLFRDFRVKWDKGFGAGGRRGIFLLQKAVTFSFAGFLEKEDAVVGVGMMV